MSRGNVTIKTRSSSSIEGLQLKSEKLQFFEMPTKCCNSITKLDGKGHEMGFLGQSCLPGVQPVLIELRRKNLSSVTLESTSFIFKLLIGLRRKGPSSVTLD